MNARVALALALAALAPPSRAAETAALSNLSVRTTLAANQPLIVGAVVSGGAKNILVRAGGPALGKFGLAGMADPQLSLYTTGSAPIATNNDWPAALATTFAAVGAFAFDTGSKDAALVQSLNGAFTAQASGPGPGTILVEAYDVAGGLTPRLVNLSARNRVGTGADILIAGFNISGSGSKSLLVRGVGPGLAPLGVTGTLADPVLRLFNGAGTAIATNDNWDPALAATFAAVGAFPLPAGSRDAAMTVTLSPGAYSVQVSGATNGTGEAIVEVYEIADPLFEARLPNRVSSATAVHLGFPRMAPALPSIGNVRVKVIFVDFSDAVATRTPQNVFGILSPGSEDLWRGTSYGKLNLTLDPSFGWLRMSKPSTQYGWSALTNALHRAYIQEAVNLALAAGADFSTCDAVAVMSNPDAGAISNGPTFVAGSVANGIAAGGKTLTVAITSGRDLLGWGYKWFSHEGGHMMGLADLYAYDGPQHRFVGDYSLMGLISGTAPEYLGWERWLLGWLDDDQVVAPDHGVSTIALTPIEAAGGRKLVVVPTGATTAVVVEYRRPLGLDTALVKTGLLVYAIDTSLRSGEGVIQVLPGNDADTRKVNNTLGAGQSLTASGVTVRNTGADANSATVEITRP